MKKGWESGNILELGILNSNFNLFLGKEALFCLLSAAHWFSKDRIQVFRFAKGRILLLSDKVVLLVDPFC